MSFSQTISSYLLHILLYLNTSANIARAQHAKAPGVRKSHTDQVQPVATDQIQRQRNPWWWKRKEFISMRPSPGRQQNSVLKTVSKVLKILTGLYKENVGLRSVGSCRWAVKIRWSLSWDQHGQSGQSLLLPGIVSVPIKGCFAHEVFCLS